MDPNDPRTIRTDDALRAASYRLGASKPIEQVSVTELCAAAGVSRVTFYRRARTPAELLSADLEERLLMDGALFLDAQPTATGAELLQAVRESIDRLTAHVEQFADIYAPSFSQCQSVLSYGLRAALFNTVLGYVDSRRTEIVLPKELLSQPWSKVSEILAQSYAANTLAIIQVWLSQPIEQRDRAELASWILALAPAWNRRLLDLGGGRV